MCASMNSRNDVAGVKTALHRSGSGSRHMNCPAHEERNSMSTLNISDCSVIFWFASRSSTLLQYRGPRHGCAKMPKKQTSRNYIGRQKPSWTPRANNWKLANGLKIHMVTLNEKQKMFTWIYDCTFFYWAKTKWPTSLSNKLWTLRTGDQK